MADSWEDEADEKIVMQPKRLNANAPTFSFNPGASTFSPGSFKPAGQAQQSSQAVPQKVAESPAAENSRENSGNAGLGGDAPAQSTSRALASPDRQTSHPKFLRYGSYLGDMRIAGAIGASNSPAASRGTWELVDPSNRQLCCHRIVRRSKSTRRTQRNLFVGWGT